MILLASMKDPNLTPDFGLNAKSHRSSQTICTGGHRVLKGSESKSGARARRSKLCDLCDLATVFDQLPGLLVKFYAVNDLTTTSLNEYSSIYLWSKPSFLTGLFTGDLFENYANAFGRPTPRWALVDQVAGDFDQLQQAQNAIRQTIGIPRKTHIGQFVKAWEKRQDKSNLLARVIAIDPTGWELIDFQFASERIAHRVGVNAHVYEIVHVSLPK
jgi:Domain of unknown function (DUF4865)